MTPFFWGGGLGQESQLLQELILSGEPSEQPLDFGISVYIHVCVCVCVFVCVWGGRTKRAAARLWYIAICIYIYI